MNKVASFPIRVAFIMQVPVVWDKLEPIFQWMSRQDSFYVFGILVPGGGHEIGREPFEYQWFHNRCNNVIDAIDAEGNVIDLSALDLDYVFYQRPYDQLLPPTLRCSHVRNFAKTCYIPYGYTLKSPFWDKYYFQCSDFFDSIYFLFTDSKNMERNFQEFYCEACHERKKKILFLGYPALESCFQMETYSKEKIDSLLWTPTFSAIKAIGASHFFDYRENFLGLRDMYPNLRLSMRPHSLMWKTFLDHGRMTQDEINEYLDRMEQLSIQMDSHDWIAEAFTEADILLTDYTGAIVRFFLMNRPVVYCPSHDDDLIVDGFSLMEGIYVASSWDDVERYLKPLVNGDDTLRSNREKIISSLEKDHKGATQRICQEIYRDFTES